LKRISVGIIGCGGIAQMMYLPYLKDLKEKYYVKAVCDVSPKLVSETKEKYNLELGFTEVDELLNITDIDAVIILTPYHTEQVIKAALAGKHVLVEKPMCYNLQEADRIIKAAEEADIKLMVAYMKRYDPGYQLGVERIKKMKNIKFIRAHDFPHDNNCLISDIYDIPRFNDIPSKLVEETKERITEAKVEALGSRDETALEAYQMLLGVASHDINILRGALGEPRRILRADIWNQGSSVLVIMDYGENCKCVFEVARTKRKWFEEELVVFSDQETVRISFPSPFHKNAATKLSVREMEGGTIAYKEYISSYAEAFKLELEQFHRVITEDIPILTTAYEAKEDIRLLGEMVRHYLAR